MSKKLALSTRKKLLFSFVTLLVFFAAAEGALRLLGFQYETRVEAMKFTFPLERFDIENLSQEEVTALMEKGVPVLQRDPVLFWKPTPGLMGHNSHCVHGPEFDVPKPAGIFRIVCLGDSCTHFGPDSYASHLQETLKSRRSESVEVINAGVAGYSSHQGLARLRTEVVNWRPNLVTVYFGWNDHWLARGLADRDQKPQIGGISDLLGRYRVYQLLLAAGQSLAPAGPTSYRVPLTDYADNLRSIKRACDEMHARTIFITAPHALELGIPEYLETMGEIENDEGLIPLHERYNDVVREISSELGVPLVDFARECDARDKAELFIEDHIHLSQKGRILASELIAEAIEKAGNF